MNIIYRICEDEKLEDVCKFYKTTKEKICEFNDVDSWRVGKLILITKQKTYVVSPNDTIEKIAKKFGVDEKHIKELNKVNQIFIGEKLKI